MFGRRQAAIVVAEFLGTGLLALAMLSVQHSTIGLPYFVALAAGIAMATLTIVFGRDDGAHFNPAITIGMWTARQIKTLPAAAYIVAQMLGAWAAYYAYTYFVKTSLQPIGGHYDGRVLVAEAVGTMVLGFAFAAAAFGRFERGKTALTVGSAFALAIIVASSAAIGIANPAVALSMRAFDVFGSMGWGTYVLGPVLGSVIAFNLYALLFAPESSLLRMKAVMQSSGSVAHSAMAAATAEKPERTAKAAPKRAGRSSRTRKSRK